MGSFLGAHKVAAMRLDIPTEEYTLMRLNGNKWCSACQSWQPRKAFHKGSTRCVPCHRIHTREYHRKRTKSLTAGKGSQNAK
jgi:hypothetical protein